MPFSIPRSRIEGKHRTLIGIECDQWLTSSKRVMSVSHDQKLRYNTLLTSIQDATRQPALWTQTIKLSTKMIDLSQFEIDLPMRHHSANEILFNPINPVVINPYYPLKQFTPIYTSWHKPNPTYALNLLNSTPDIPWVTNPKSINNQYMAYRKRLVSVRPTINLIAKALLRKTVENWLSENLTPLPKLDHDVLFDTWLEENKTYTLNRKTQLREAKKNFIDTRQ